MGKKRVIQKSADELIAENKKVEDSISGKASQTSKHKYSEGRVYIQATYNNTIMTVTDEKGDVITWMSAGALGFSGPKKSTPFAAGKVADAVFEKISKSGPFKVSVYVKGVGGGRDAAIKALANRGFNLTAIKDITAVPHNGPKPPKPRRV